MIPGRQVGRRRRDTSGASSLALARKGSRTEEPGARVYQVASRGRAGVGAGVGASRVRMSRMLLLPCACSRPTSG